MPTPDSAIENILPAKKARGGTKANANKVSKPGKVARRRSGDSVARVVRKGAPGQKAMAATKKRSALREQVNLQPNSDTEDMADFEACDDGAIEGLAARGTMSGDELDASIVSPIEPKERSRPPKPKNPKDPIARVKKHAASRKQRIIQEETPDMARHVDQPAKVSRPLVKKATAVMTQPVIDVMDDQAQFIAETQPLPVEQDDSMFAGDDQNHFEEPTPQPIVRHSSIGRSMSQPRPQPAGMKRRGGSVSESERTEGASGGGSDPALRRKLGEITRRFENLDYKYRSVREVGIKEAEVNFAKLERQMVEKGNGMSVSNLSLSPDGMVNVNGLAADKLISSLKTELVSQTTLARESRSLEKQLAVRAAEMERLQSQVSQLTSSLAATETENKSLSAKLAVSRNNSNNNSKGPSSNQGSDIRVPSSAIKGSRVPATAASAEAARAAQMAQSKEDLYSDLTGLILRNVKRNEECDIFDCIQTGRNGSRSLPLSLSAKQQKLMDRKKTKALHFRLTLSKPPSYEDTEFVFTPLLDPSRDRDLIDLLPDYLTEEITFARENAEKFYGRVVETLTKNGGGGRN